MFFTHSLDQQHNVNIYFSDGNKKLYLTLFEILIFFFAKSHIFFVNKMFDFVEY